MSGVYTSPLPPGETAASQSALFDAAAVHQIFSPYVGLSYSVNSMPRHIVLPAFLSTGATNPAPEFVVLKNSGGGQVAVLAGISAATIFNAPGAIVLAPGQMVLSANPGLTAGLDATVQCVAGTNATLTILRGSLDTVFLFPSPGAEIF